MSGIHSLAMAPLDSSTDNTSTPSPSAINSPQIHPPFDLNDSLPELEAEPQPKSQLEAFHLNRPPTASTQEEEEDFFIEIEQGNGDEEFVAEWLDDDSDVQVTEYDWTDSETDEEHEKEQEIMAKT